MTIDLHKTDSNQHIFDSFVRTVLDSYRIPLIDQPIEGLIESIEHGEGSVDTALNLIVVAHVTHLFLEVSAPNEEPEWADTLRGLTPRIESALALCRDLLVKNLPYAQKRAKGDIGVYDNDWHVVVPAEYGMDSWEEFKDSPFLVHTQPQIYSFSQDTLLSLLRRGESANPIDLVNFVKIIFSPHQFVQTAWHRFVVRDVIRAFMEKPQQLNWEAWCTMVDLCAKLLQSAELLGADMVDLEDEHGIFTSELRLPLTSAEHWAWEFGRVAAMWPVVDKSIFEDNFGAEYFDGWDNGLSALSLISAAQEPGDLLVDRCWLGAFATWRSVPESEPGLIRVGEPTYPAFQLASDHLFWLMRLGYLDGVKRIGQRELQTQSVDPTNSDVLLLGSPEQTGRALLDIQAKAEQERENQIKNELVERLGKVWDELPADSQYHLISAEVNLSNYRAPDASLDYAIAVEVALSEWLKPSKSTRDWPDDDIGKWASCISKMTGPKSSRHSLDPILRQWFDPRVASELGEALNIFRNARLTRAHGKRRPPYAKKAQETALGTEQRKGVFELILRFAKRWRG